MGILTSPGDVISQVSTRDDDDDDDDVDELRLAVDIISCSMENSCRGMEADGGGDGSAGSANELKKGMASVGDVVTHD